MRSGFLLGGQPNPATQAVGCNVTGAADAAAPPQHSPEAAAAAAAAARPQPTPEQAEHALAECLELLKGPSDERRCVCQLQGTATHTLGTLAGGESGPACMHARAAACRCRVLPPPLADPASTASNPHHITHPPQVCGPAAGHQAAASGRRCHGAARARRHRPHLPLPPAAAAARGATQRGTARQRQPGGRPEGGCRRGAGPGGAVQLHSGARPGGGRGRAGKGAAAAQRRARRRHRAAAGCDSGARRRQRRRRRRQQQRVGFRTQSDQRASGRGGCSAGCSGGRCGGGAQRRRGLHRGGGERRAVGGGRSAAALPARADAAAVAGAGAAGGSAG